MSDSAPHYRAQRVVALSCGLFAMSYVHERRRRRQMTAPPPLARLNARQAMGVAGVANISGMLAMAVFAAYYVATMCQL